MKMIHYPGGTFILAFSFLIFFSIPSNGQEYDTLSNWDGITQNWYVSTPGSEVVTNPAPGEVNASEHCIKVITAEGPYDYMISDLAAPVNFDLCPRYRLKVLAPPSGGNITLKFENYNNTFWQEIVLTPVPGEWTDLEYDFSGLVYNDLTRMVIFPDFQGTTPGIAWYIDDVLREACEEPGPLELESNLPIIVINTFGEPIPDDPKITARMGIIDNGPGMMNSLDDPFNNFNGVIGIEIRGNSTMWFPKNSYALETRDTAGQNLDVALLGLPEENDWVLYAPYSDKSMLRNVVSFEMGRMMGQYCSRSVFCELVVNNDYKGVYTLMEKIKKDENRVDIAALNPEDVTGIELTGGYILRVDWVDPDFIYDEDGWESKPVPSYPGAKPIIFQYYYPEPDEMAIQQKAYIRDLVTDAEKALISSTFANPDNGYQKYFDVLSFVDYMLLSEIPKEVDKYRFSTFFYKEKDTDGGKLYAGPAWDFDLGYGNVDYWPQGLDHTGWFYKTVEPHEWSIMFWWKRMMEDPYFRDFAKTRWVWLRQQHLAYGNLQSMMDSIIAYTGEARDRNYERWPILGTYIWPNYNWYGNNYEDEVYYFKDFLFRRMTWMDENFAGTVIHPQAGISAENNQILVHLYTDYFCSQDLKTDYFKLNNSPGSVGIESVTYKSASECVLTLSESVTGFPDISVTISDKAINYWEDITSSTLASSGIGDYPTHQADIRLFENDHNLHILCDQPEYLPETAQIVNLAGQTIMTFRLEKFFENILPLSLSPGIYVLILKADTVPKSYKFVVSL
jgi:hypothetical protein